MNRWASKIIFPILQSHSAAGESAYATYPASQPEVVLHRVAAEGRTGVLSDIVRELMGAGKDVSDSLRRILRSALLYSIRGGVAAVTRDVLLAYRAHGVVLYTPSLAPSARLLDSIRELVVWCMYDVMGAKFMDVLALSACTMLYNESVLHALMRMPFSPPLIATVEALGPDSWSRASARHATPLSMLIDEGNDDRIMTLLPFIPADAFVGTFCARNPRLFDGCGLSHCTYARTPCRLVHVDISSLSLRVFREVLERYVCAVPVGEVRQLCRSLVNGDREDTHAKMLLVLSKFPSFEGKAAIVHACPPEKDMMANPPVFTTLADSTSPKTDPAVLSLVLEYVVNPWNIWKSTRSNMRNSVCTSLITPPRGTCANRVVHPFISNTEALLRILLEHRHQGEGTGNSDVYGDFYIGHDSRYDDNIEVYIRHLGPEFLEHALETVPLGDHRHSTKHMCKYMHIAISLGKHEVARVLEAHLPNRESARAYMEQHHVEDVAHIYPVLAKRASC